MTGEARTRRPGGRSARVQAAVHAATVELMRERDGEGVTLPAVAERAGVNPTTIYRRWGNLAALLVDVAAQQADGCPAPTGDLRSDLEAYAVWTLADLTRPGGVAFFKAEVPADVDERRAGLGDCLERCSTRINLILDAARARGQATPTLEQILDRVVAPLYFHVVFSLPGTDERYGRALINDLLADAD